MSQRFFESPKTVEVRALKGAFLLGGATIFPLPRRLLTMLPERHTFPENGNYWGGPFNSRSPGLPISLVGQEGVRGAMPFQRQGNSGAAPATVGGEPFSEKTLGYAKQSPGRQRKVWTREPRDLPERRHPSGGSGRAFAVAAKSVVTPWRPPWLGSNEFYLTNPTCERGLRSAQSARCWSSRRLVMPSQRGLSVHRGFALMAPPTTGLGSTLAATWACKCTALGLAGHVDPSRPVWS